MTKHGRRILLVVVVLLALILVAIAFVVGRLRFAAAATSQMPMLAGAVWYYYDEFGELAPDLNSLESQGYYNPCAYRLPSHGFESQQSPTGPRVRYLPVGNLSEGVRYVIAIRPRHKRLGGGRVYLFFDGQGVGKVEHVENDDQLRAVLEADNALRSANGEKKLWNVAQETEPKE